VTWCWGGYLAERTKVETNLSFTNLFAGRATDACGLTEQGRAYCWTLYYDDWYYYTAEMSARSPSAASGYSRRSPWVMHTPADSSVTRPGESSAGPHCFRAARIDRSQYTFSVWGGHDASSNR
jgi:hypothetical protein